MLHPALGKLIQLYWRGNLRQFGKSLRTVRGLLQMFFILGMSLYGLASLYFASLMGGQSAPLANLTNQLQNEILPFGLLIYTCYALLFSTGEATVYFTASEVAFLFPAPISRQQLLVYLLLKSLLGILALSLFFALFSSAQLSMAVPRWIAIILTLAFLQLITMNVAFARQIMRDRLNGLVRRGLGVVIFVLFALAARDTLRSLAGTDLQAYLNAFKSTAIGTAMLAPFQIFVRCLRAENWQAFLANGIILLGVDVGLLLLAFRLDGLSLEAAVSISEKMTDRIKNLQTRGLWYAFSPKNSRVAARRIPFFPFWGGIGPILWQRLSTTFRSSSNLLWVLAGIMAIVGAVVYGFSQSKSPSEREFAAPLLGVGAMAYISFLICLTLQNDLNRIGYLKSLPIRPWAIVIGDLIGFPFLLSLVQSLFIIVLAVAFPSVTWWLLALAPLTFPMNFLVFGIDKLVFYVYPTRMSKGAPGDFQNSGKQMVFIALKMLMLGVASLIVAAVTVPLAIGFNSPLVAFISAGVLLMLECVGLIPLLLLAYDRFDPSTIIVQ